MPDRRRADDRAAGRLELAQRRRVERMDRGDGRAVERGIEFAPFARRHHRPGGEAERLEHHADADRIGREHLAEQRDGRRSLRLRARRLHRPLLRLDARIRSMAPASTSLASAWVGTPKPGTSMPMMRTPLISFGSSRSGTPDAVGTQRLMMTMAS